MLIFAKQISLFSKALMMGRSSYYPHFLLNLCIQLLLLPSILSTDPPAPTLKKSDGKPGTVPNDPPPDDDGGLAWYWWLIIVCAILICCCCSLIIFCCLFDEGATPGVSKKSSSEKKKSSSHHRKSRKPSKPSKKKWFSKFLIFESKTLFLSILWAIQFFHSFFFQRLHKLKLKCKKVIKFYFLTAVSTAVLLKRNTTRVLTLTFLSFSAITTCSNWWFSQLLKSYSDQLQHL